MANPKSRDPLIERRDENNLYQDLWSHLTLAQKFSASSLEKQGYKLSFIRCATSGNIAIMVLGNKLISIACDGDIDTNPQIEFR